MQYQCIFIALILLTAMAEDVFTDIHCHSSFKPYGRSFTDGSALPDPVPGDIVSLCHDDDTTDTNAFLSEKFDVAMYTQSDFNAAAVSGVQVMDVSLVQGRKSLHHQQPYFYEASAASFGTAGGHN